LTEKYTSERQTCGKLARKATVSTPLALKLVLVKGKISLDAVPHVVARFVLVATAKAAMVREKEAMLAFQSVDCRETLEI
jgi:Na+(H+)/acetate symporter ActP